MALPSCSEFFFREGQMRAVTKRAVNSPGGPSSDPVHHGC